MEKENIMIKRSSISRVKLSKAVVEILQDGMEVGFSNNELNLLLREIRDDMMPELCGWITKLKKKISYINLQSNKISSKGASMLFATLMDMKNTLYGLNISGNRLTDPCMQELGELLKENQAMIYLYIGSNKISDTGMSTLCDHIIANNNALRYVGITACENISNKSLPLILKMIETTKIEEINLSCTGISQRNEVQAQLTLNQIKNGKTILELRRTAMTDDGIHKICKCIKVNGTVNVNDIDLSGNYITAKGAALLFDSLRYCISKVAFLNLEGNKLGDDCMEALGSYLEDNISIKDVKIGNCGITDKGVDILSLHLIGNTNLEHLGLQFNLGITEESTPFILDIAQKSQIKRVTLSRTMISEESQEKTKCINRHGSAVV